ncbi:hypothetical protein L1987_60533 [Smallanthus sonchifolius]|uniref:Uncharacterized protein n=1 Tax=Smallanthus sonchifolius TaxID=185202 RepID=A0ACB9D8D6_9ASTR|nr:hypothetical protein L1987_60533 [Smallanthus sonchifolius]
METMKRELLFILWLNLLMLLRSSESAVPQHEVVAVNSILTTMGATNWSFNGDTCNLDLISEVPKLSQEANASTGCDCSTTNNSDCHVVRMYNTLVLLCSAAMH